MAAVRREHLRATKTTSLFTAEESRQIMRRAGEMGFRVQGDQEDEPREGLKARHYHRLAPVPLRITCGPTAEASSVK
jgi:hypothetical protein